MADLRLLPSQHPTGLALRSLRAQRLAVSWSGPAIKRLGIAPCGSSERAALAPGIAALARRKRPREPRLRGRAGGDGVQLSAPFQTKMRVYIEDTDCFGVVFYANYFRFFQRALCELYAFSGWQQPFIVGIRQARYKQAAKLGDLVTVQVEPDVAPDDSSELGEWWHVTARTEEDCVTAVVQVTDGQLDLGRGEFPAMASSGPPTEISRFERHAFPVPSLHDLLRWFERSRSDAVGGPQALQDVVDLGILIVVARIDRLEYFPSLVPRGDSAWVVRSHVDYKPRRGQMICEERLYAVGEAGEADVCVARVLVRCVCISEATRRIVRGPPELAAMIGRARGE
ncbi:unnamed protein product [Effrenium voratum]|nr:unnamed protein product [Effrenium voratum]